MTQRSFEVTASALNLRAVPISGEVLTQLPRGHIVERIEDSAEPGWLHVSTIRHLREFDGHVAAQFLMPDDGKPQSDPAFDGELTVTMDKLRRLAPTGKGFILGGLDDDLSKIAEPFGIMNSNLRLCHFLAQAAHESAGFRTLEEFASGKAYEGRLDLGNTQSGDGVRFKGRGIFQLTGRHNYTKMSKKLGVDLVENPKLAQRPDISLKTACHYWDSRKINHPADRDDIRTVTKKINGGTNGLSDRQHYYKLARMIWG